MHRRREFSAQTKRDAFDRSGGICECYRVSWLRRPKGCGVKLVTGAIFSGKNTLTEADVREIRASKDTAQNLALKFGVAENSIYRIRLRQRWAHLDAPFDSNCGPVGRRR